jgi:hypothetical protein
MWMVTSLEKKSEPLSTLMRVAVPRLTLRILQLNSCKRFAYTLQFIAMCSLEDSCISSTVAEVLYFGTTTYTATTNECRDQFKCEWMSSWPQTNRTEKPLTRTLLQTCQTPRCAQSAGISVLRELLCSQCSDSHVQIVQFCESVATWARRDVLFPEAGFRCASRRCCSTHGCEKGGGRQKGLSR